ncbi:hypothetical protein L21SP5_03131 [Salinivirga cyanobacteriivorans]|uniref:Outer membrane protein beta-barrel domain-containing protein n=1 Tax=Salinivirga cyanobacteriivorans TaxID=1307839 RepID=A0A0S2I3D1_9BACT|nr:porin family protein [Salinivirga cyanobacteriivorans]ALO16746.1 hypothetical protein L21SP5_03131 [Salinivirga cyanobacteriivorans]
MKKITFLMLAMVFVNLIHAQLFTIGNQEIGFVYIGPKIGMGGAWVSNLKIDNEETGTLFTYQFGVVGKFGVTNRLSIQPELIFSRKGSKVKSDEFDYEGKRFADYIGIPILAKLSFIKIGDFRLHGSGGIYSNVTLDQKSVYEYSFETFEHSIEKEFYKKVDFGFSFGGGAEYELDYGLIVGEILIEHGAVDIYTNDISTESNRNTTVSFAATYLFDIIDLTSKSLKDKEAPPTEDIE